MKRETEVALARELLDLHARKSANLGEAVTARAVEDYFDPGRFQRERERIMRTVPQPAVHSSELPEPGSFLRREITGLPVLFTRDADGTAHAFLNVCRHRGTRLVDEQQGCKQRFSCPYHAWTWNNRGELIGIPHDALGFPDVDRDQLGLKRLGCQERHGWVWVSPVGDETPDIDASLAGLAEDFDWFAAGESVLVHVDVEVRAVNWKILVEGGLEAYHFRVAHRETIGPYFLDNTSTFQSFGPHLRSILGRRSLTDLADRPEDAWRLRDHAQILYSIFPLSQILVQADNFAWLQLEPISASATAIKVATFAPGDRVASEADRERWARNHAITMETLAEDFAIGESIQAGLESGANTHLTFGRFESALAEFNRSVDSRL